MKIAKVIFASAFVFAVALLSSCSDDKKGEEPSGGEKIPYEYELYDGFIMPNLSGREAWNYDYYISFDKSFGEGSTLCLEYRVKDGKMMDVYAIMTDIWVDKFKTKPQRLDGYKKGERFKEMIVFTLSPNSPIQQTITFEVRPIFTVGDESVYYGDVKTITAKRPNK